MSTPIFTHKVDKQEISLHSPTELPDASGFLWNSRMMVQVNCRGYASAQHMQPEPAKYSYQQSLEAKTFMQPEHHYSSSHPGRFFFIKLEGHELFSIPYEPMRIPLDSFEFIQGTDELKWKIKQGKLHLQLVIRLGKDEALEHWSLSLLNNYSKSVKVEVYPCFSIGYASWMNQSAKYNDELNGVLANYITPYQKVEDYPINKHFMDNTVLLADTKVESYDTCLKTFEGEGGLHNPDALQQDSLFNSISLYQTPVAALHHIVELSKEQSKDLAWVFGPVKNESHAKEIKNRVFNKTAIEDELQKPTPSTVNDNTLQYKPKPRYRICTDNKDFDQFVNCWLPRQVDYHCQSERLTRDPQTRNYLQDHMVQSIFEPEKAKESFLFALSQQASNGAMPDGILLDENASLKYINQIPHTDHNVWLFIFLHTYLAHTGDIEILEKCIPFKDDKTAKSVFEHLVQAAEYLYKQTDHRRLSFIEQGDWCDPMNMVGKEGKGVSIWLTLASAYAISIFADICIRQNKKELSIRFRGYAQSLNDAANEHAWDGNWYARGICDNDRIFGVSKDIEGKIYLNPQAWSMLSGAATFERQSRLLHAVEHHLETPNGVEMLAPAYTQMDEDIGRLTQKFPGTAENGSVYNHAACFYAFALLSNGFAEKGFKVLQKMLITQENVKVRRQLPNFVPNYFRGAFYQHPEVSGRSSHLFNTGTCAWYYRCVIESMFGIKKDKQGIYIQPCLSRSLGRAQLLFEYAESSLSIRYMHNPLVNRLEIIAPDLIVQDNYVKGFEVAKRYSIEVIIPPNLE